MNQQTIVPSPLIKRLPRGTQRDASSMQCRKMCPLFPETIMKAELNMYMKKRYHYTARFRYAENVCMKKIHTKRGKMAIFLCKAPGSLEKY